MYTTPYSVKTGDSFSHRYAPRELTTPGFYLHEQAFRRMVAIAQTTTPESISASWKYTTYRWEPQEPTYIDVFLYRR